MLKKGKNFPSKSTITKLSRDGANADVKIFFEQYLPSYLVGLRKLENRSILSSSTTKSLDENIYKAFAARTTDILRKGEKLLRKVKSKAERKRIQRVFQRTLIPWLRGNPFVQRCLTKPRGYPGDYMMMELGYENKQEFSGGLNGFFDHYFIDAYRAVVYRKDKLKKSLRKLLVQKNGEIRVLTLGGGPAREWVELDQEKILKESSRVYLTYLDQDQEAHDFVKSRLTNNHLIRSVKYIRESLFTFARSVKWDSLTGTYDFIYGLGIADYFYDEALAGIVRRAFTLLRRGGRLLITHKNIHSFNFVAAGWLCDWHFVQRGETALSMLMKHALSSSQLPFQLKIERDKTGEILFAVAIRD